MFTLTEVLYHNYTFVMTASQTVYNTLITWLRYHILQILFIDLSFCVSLSHLYFPVRSAISPLGRTDTEEVQKSKPYTVSSYQTTRHPGIRAQVDRTVPFRSGVHSRLMRYSRCDMPSLEEEGKNRTHPCPSETHPGSGVNRSTCAVVKSSQPQAPPWKSQGGGRQQLVAVGL